MGFNEIQLGSREKCPLCFGKGRIAQVLPSGMHPAFAEVCYVCDGDGYIELPELELEKQEGKLDESKRIKTILI